ncbi:MAG: NAD(P)-dependent oxidoreductase, partial [Pseudomonadota bacterium]
DKHVLNTSGAWAPAAPPLAGDRTVAVLGLGALGRAAGTALAQLGFHVVGWSRSAKDIPSIECYHGESGLSEALAKAEIAVLLLPNTPDTENLLNAERLRLLPQGAVILNPGRGSLIDDEALLAALDDGHIGHATLDVFRNEPLPSEHPYWRHARVTVTPHIASETRPGSASRTIAVNIKRGEDGAPFLHLVDREKGY